MFLIKNRITNTKNITYLFYKVNYKKNSFMHHLNFVKIMSDLPYSLKLMDNFEDNHFYYCVYDYFDETLQGFIEKNSPISSNLIHKILLQLNICLKKLNEMHAIHKFINPQNIFITYLDESKENFDIKLGGYDITNERVKSRHSSVGFDMDKIFIAPEVEELDFSLSKCDLYSIGHLIYYLYTNELPKKNKLKKEISEPELNDLVKGLCKEHPEDRIDFEEYYNHPFFKKYHNLI